MGGLTWGDIGRRCAEEGYYEIDWEFFKKIAPKIRTVDEIIFHACRDKEKFLRGAHEFPLQPSKWPSCELEFEIIDGEIWEIQGTDAELVDRRKKFFSPLPMNNIKITALREPFSMLR